jgi:hypothetical protein
VSIDYNRLAATATRLLTDNGQPMALRRTSGGTFDPVTGTTTGQSTADLATVGVKTKITLEYAARNNVQEGDELMLLDASQEPLPTDKLVIGSEVRGIVRVNPIKPAAIAVAYYVQTRA